MKTCRNKNRLAVFGRLFTAGILIIISGCNSSRVSTPPEEDSLVRRIRISAITEFVQDPETPNGMQIKTLVEFFDVHGFLTKSSCTLRFEFYEFRSVSSDPRGQRLLIWPNWDLSDPEINDKHWKQFLRGYEFFLPLDVTLQDGKKYVLEVTCLIDQKRYGDIFKMQFQP